MSSGSWIAALAERAGERLAAAGRRALWRGDNRTAAAAARASARAAPAATRRCPAGARPRGCAAGDPHRARGHRRHGRRARATRRATGPGRHSRASSRHTRACTPTTDADVDELERLAQLALPLLEEAEDHAGLGHVWAALGGVANFRVRFEDRARATEQALRHDGWRVTRTGCWPADALVMGRGPPTRRFERLTRSCRALPSRTPASPARAARDARPLRRGLGVSARASER